LPDPPDSDRPGDRWRCGRDGKDLPCSQGPSQFGTCPSTVVCQPQRTWHGRRKQIATLFITLLVALLAIFSQQRWSTQQRRAQLFKPGDLTTPHAQILSGTMISDRCAACHSEAATSAIEWFSKDARGHADVSQTDRCLNCHHSTIDRPTATLAHNLPDSTLNSIRLASVRSTDRSWHDLMPSPAIDQENIQCNACHREHRGANHDLSAVSDLQCQTCHSDRFGSFASSHPQWGRWPYGRGRKIAFNHASHANKHFPATKQGNSTTQFQCADCHRKTVDNELTRVTTYERGCQSCHEQGLKVETAEGIELLALPSLSTDSAVRVGGWPERATGFYDGQLAPMTELLFRSDSETEQSIREIPMGDFSRIDTNNRRSIAAAEQIGKAYQKLLENVSTEGQDAIAKRIAATGVTPSSAASFVRSLPTQLIARAGKDWFKKSSELNSLGKSDSIPFRPPIVAKPDDSLRLLDEEPRSDALLESDDDLLNDNDLLAEDPLSESTKAVQDRPTRFDPDKMLSKGGWYRDDVTLAIRYRGAGHEDPVLKSAIDVIRQLPASDPVRQRLLKTQAVAACISCHPGALLAADGWKSEPLIGARNEFTKFTHGPHLNVAKLADCVHCHQINRKKIGADSDFSVNLASRPSDTEDFAPIERQACSSCHTSSAAGDSCVKCHRYHIDVR